MKKYPLFRLIGLLPAFLLINHSEAQSSAGSSILLHKTSLKTFAERISTGIEFSAALQLLDNINQKMSRDFARQFGAASDISIYTDESGATSITCKVNGVLNRLTYNRKGNLVSQLRYYGDEGLPKHVRHLVRSNWYDYAIAYVVEVNYSQKTAYVVTLEDKISWKIIKVVDGEMEVMEEFNKN